MILMGMVSESNWKMCIEPIVSRHKPFRRLWNKRMLAMFEAIRNQLDGKKHVGSLINFTLTRIRRIYRFELGVQFLSVQSILIPGGSCVLRNAVCWSRSCFDDLDVEENEGDQDRGRLKDWKHRSCLAEK
jgi:hypothetical protein